jgi:hypothetical protein
LQTEVLIKEDFIKITLKEREFTNVQMAESKKENGKITKWKDMEFLHCQMAENTRVNISMIKRREKEHYYGQMEENMMEIGKMESNMA